MSSPLHYGMGNISCLVVLVAVLLWVECTVRSEPLSQRDDFNAQVEYLLSEELMTADEIARVMDSVEDLKNTLTRRWEGAELYLYGSTKAGLAMKTSDLDVHVKIPGYNYSARAYFVQETAKIFYQEPLKYSNVRFVMRPNLSRVSYYNILLGLKVDLSLNSHDGVEVTKLIKYFINLDERYISLVVLVKFWSRIHEITASGSYSNYHFYSMTIFYLQQNNLAPSVYQMQVNTPPRIVNEWNANFKEIPFNVANNESLHELLGGFFKYYSEFDFDNYCISVYVGRPVLRADLVNIDTIPDELVMYKNCLRTGDCKPPNVHTAVCLQDVFKHDFNSADRIISENLLKLINHLKFAVKMYETLPSGLFLRSISANRTIINKIK